MPWWARNSAVECCLHMAEVTGSNPVAPTPLRRASLLTPDSVFWFRCELFRRTSTTRRGDILLKLSPSGNNSWTQINREWFEIFQYHWFSRCDYYLDRVELSLFFPDGIPAIIFPGSCLSSFLGSFGIKKLSRRYLSICNIDHKVLWLASYPVKAKNPMINIEKYYLAPGLS